MPFFLHQPNTLIKSKVYWSPPCFKSSFDQSIWFCWCSWKLLCYSSSAAYMLCVCCWDLVFVKELSLSFFVSLWLSLSLSSFSYTQQAIPSISVCVAWGNIRHRWKDCRNILLKCIVQFVTSSHSSNKSNNRFIYSVLRVSQCIVNMRINKSKMWKSETEKTQNAVLKISKKPTNYHYSSSR